MQVLVMLYAVVSYFIGVAGLAYIIAWMAGFVPGAFGGPLGSVPGGAWAWDLFLVLLFGVQHSVMARSGFKERLLKIIPAATERSTYILMSGVVSLVIVAFWSPMPGLVWQVNNGAGRIALWALFAGGWTLMLVASFGTNHFELFGLRQAYCFFRGRTYSPLPFTRSGIYGWIRHPIQTGILLGIWSIPDMRLDHLVLSLGFTAYVFIGLRFEERDLIRVFGEKYAQYASEVGGLLPKLGAGKR